MFTNKGMKMKQFLKIQNESKNFVAGIKYGSILALIVLEILRYFNVM